MRNTRSHTDQAEASSRAIRAAYASAHYGKSLFWYASELLFGFYLAEIYQIPPTTLGTLLFVFLLWDAITDPILGVIVWRRHTSLPTLLNYQLVGAIISAITFLLIFFKPNLSQDYLTIYALFFGLLFRTAYTIFDVPQNALMRRLALSNNQRLVLSSYRTALSALATLTISFASTMILAPVLVEDIAFNFTVSALIFSPVAIGSALILKCVAKNWREIHEKAEQPRSSFSQLKFTLLHPSLIKLYIAIFFLSIGWPLFGKLVPFYASYVLGNAKATGYVLTVIAVAALVSQPLWIRVGNTISRNKAVVVCTVLVFISCIFFVVTATRNEWFAFVAVALLSASASAMGVFAWVLLADRLSDPQLKNANDLLAFGTFTFASKIALGLGGLMLGVVLDHIGFQAGVPLDSAGQHSMIIFMAAAPALSTLGAAASILFFSFPTGR